MTLFQLEEINAGADEDSCWVARGFASAFQAKDTLFVVLAQDELAQRPARG